MRRQLRHCVLNLEWRHLLRDVRLRLLQRDLRVRMRIDWLSDRNGLLIIGHLGLLLVSELLVVLLPHVKFDWKLLYHPPQHPTSSSIHKIHQKCTLFNDVVCFLFRNLKLKLNVIAIASTIKPAIALTIGLGFRRIRCPAVVVTERRVAVDLQPDDGHSIKNEH